MGEQKIEVVAIAFVCEEPVSREAKVRTVTLLTRARQVGFVLNRSPKHSSPWFEPKALDMMATV